MMTIIKKRTNKYEVIVSSPTSLVRHYQSSLLPHSCVQTVMFVHHPIVHDVHVSFKASLQLSVALHQRIGARAVAWVMFVVLEDNSIISAICNERNGKWDQFAFNLCKRGPYHVAPAAKQCHEGH